MLDTEAHIRAPELAFGAVRPQLIFAYTETSGPSRRMAGHLAQVIQRRKNHDSFQLFRLDIAERPELADRLGVTEIPSLVVVEDRKVAGRLTRPHGPGEIRSFLDPWLR
jgi:thioredoxin-like negative regulator of GroEL